MPAAKNKPLPPASDTFLDQPLIGEDDFRRKMKNILSVPREELDQHIADNPDPPQKRGRVPKEKE